MNFVVKTDKNEKRLDVTFFARASNHVTRVIIRYLGRRQAPIDWWLMSFYSKGIKDKDKIIMRRHLFFTWLKVGKTKFPENPTLEISLRTMFCLHVPVICSSTNPFKLEMANHQ
jgi:hypothetical protein